MVNILRINSCQVIMLYGMVLTLWCTYLYWYTNHCLLVHDLNKKSDMKNDKKSFNK